jgi:hypothetical protein
MLTWLTSLLAPTIVEKLIDEAKDLFGAYLQNKVTREQLANELKKIVLDAFVEVQKAQAESIAKTFDSFMRAEPADAERVGGRGALSTAGAAMAPGRHPGAGVLRRCQISVERRDR